MRERLSDLKVRKAKNPGLLCDGGGLYLQVSRAGTKSWIFRYRLNGHVSKNGKPLSREMGLGSLDDVSLAQAREILDKKYRPLLNEGLDPIEHRDAELKEKRAKAALDAANALTFDECRDAYIEAHKAGWRNPKHAAQWINTLETYVTPIFGKLSVQAIDRGLVLKALGPIWATKPETARRVRGRIERILDFAEARCHRPEGTNPARLLPIKTALGRQVRRVEHHAALPYDEIGAFMADLRDRDGIAPRALEFLILTAARTAEVIGARWSEIDAEAAMWVVPADRMKGGREHRVPLNDAALAVLRRMEKVRDGDHVFPGDRRAALSNMSFLMLLRRMGRGDLTAHGFRSTFRDWAAERTNFPAEVAEAALAHVVGDKVEAAYRRGDLFGKRIALMDAWAAFCAAPATTGNVVAIRAEAS